MSTLARFPELSDRSTSGSESKAGFRSIVLTPTNQSLRLLLPLGKRGVQYDRYSNPVYERKEVEGDVGPVENEKMHLEVVHEQDGATADVEEHYGQLHFF